jgi:hypothetical protein
LKKVKTVIAKMTISAIDNDPTLYNQGVQAEDLSQITDVCSENSADINKVINKNDNSFLIRFTGHNEIPTKT